MVPVYIAGNKGPVIFCMHGAGHSALSFGVFATQLKSKFTVTSFDWRGHGEHRREDETTMDQETLIEDTLDMLRWTLKRFPNKSIIMVGHSMGGSIAIKTVDRIEAMDDSEVLKKAIKAMVIIDVVEVTAMEALPFME